MDNLAPKFLEENVPLVGYLGPTYMKNYSLIYLNFKFRHFIFYVLNLATLPAFTKI